MADTLPLAEMQAFLDQLPPAETVVATVEVGEMVATLMRVALPAAVTEPWRTAPLLGVPVIVNRDLPPWTWRALNSAGEVLREEEVGLGVEPFRVGDYEIPARVSPAFPACEVWLVSPPDQVVRLAGLGPDGEVDHAER